VRLPRWLRFILIAIATVVAVALVVLYGGSEYMLRKRHPLAGKGLTLPTDSASLAAGQHLVELRGCFGCHGEGGKGQVFFDEPNIARIVAPNLTRAFASYSDTELDGIIRHGVRPDGTTLLGMPSAAFTRLSDEDFARIIAFIRSVPPVDGPGKSVSVGPLGRLGLLTGQFSVATRLVAEVAEAPTPAPPDSLVEGSYLAHTICTECHGPNLEGDPGFAVPPLAIAATYSWPEFETLMRTGKARGDRELKLMSEVARGRFSQFTPEELQALFTYLKTLGATAG
jgi:mono/diheme cytochrome c family protein